MAKPRWRGGTVCDRADGPAHSVMPLRSISCDVRARDQPRSGEGKNRAEALVVSSSPLFYANKTLLIRFAATRRLPTMYHQSEFVLGGGLMSYAPDFRDLFRRSASYVDISKHVGRVKSERVLVSSLFVGGQFIS